MNARTLGIFLAALAIVAGTGSAADNDRLRYTGGESERTPAFSRDGPWLLDWSVRSKTELPTNFEMRLYDADSGEFAGTIVQLEGTGRGLKLFEEGGNFEIQVVSENLVWELSIESVDAATAARLKQNSKGQVSLEQRSERAARQVPEGGFESWRAVGDDVLLLFAADGTTGYRVSFTPACPGLAAAKALSFVARFADGGDGYDSILLDDGTRCYFDRVAPTVFE